MFKVNILNISIWVLAGVLVIILIVVSILRAMGVDLTKNSKDNNKKNVGKVSKDMYQIILSLGSIYDLNTGYNILLKNRFSNAGYSLIPSIIVHKSTAFILTNRIKANGEEILIDNSKKVMKTKKSKTSQDGDFDYKWYKDIPKLIKSIEPSFKTEIIIPVLGSYSKLTNKSGLKVMDSNEVGDYITSSDGETSKMLELKLIEKLNELNTFKKSASLASDKAERMMK